ncbi:MAG TPA: thioesterase family protein [Chthoniobacterales bacterium]|nr:thioesterase family protein [Chthoniobacterales bacterium]
MQPVLLFRISRVFYVHLPSALMETPKLETEVQVMFFDTDAGGVVHNIAYLRFIETNRSLLAEKLGWPLSKMLNLGDCPVVVRTEIDYRKPGKLWDKLLVHGELESFERSRFWCRFSIDRPSDGQLLVTCRQMLVVVRLPELKVQRLPPHWEKEFGHLRAPGTGGESSRAGPRR